MIGNGDWEEGEAGMQAAQACRIKKF